MNRHTGRRGAALIIAVVVVLIMVGLATGFVILSAAQSKGTTDNVTRVQTFYIAEAGLNQAIDEARSGIDTAGDGIGVIAGGVYGGGTFSCTATLVDGPTQTTVVAGTPVPGTGNEELRITCTATYQNVTRRVEAVLSLDTQSLFEFGLFGDISLFGGGTINTDSYKSSEGPYDAATAYSNGDIGSNGGITLTGNSNIKGNSTAGPGFSTTLEGENVTVTGSTTPSSSPKPIPPFTYTPPATPATPFPPPPVGKGGGGASTLGAGEYHFSTMILEGARGTLNITGEVTIFVDSTISVTGLGNIVLAPGAKLTINHGGGDATFAGNGITNGDGLPASLQVNSASTSTVRIAGTSAFFGTVNAPTATVTLAGTSDTFGAIVSDVLTTEGTNNFHYDEDLALLGGGAPTYDLLSWQELPPP